MLSIPHMVVLFIIVLVVFGPNKLPELARGFGKLMAEFRKASTDFKSAFEQEMREMERQNVLAERKKAAEVAAAASAAATAAPAQPATLAAAPGTEATPAASAPEPTDTRATEALVVTPAPEAIARGAEGIEGFSNNSGGSASTNGASREAESENTIANPHRSAAPPLDPTAASTTAADPAHDTQQPA
jgi:sec-independent protein translocase protein TatB